MNEQFADLGEITICYETFGDPNDPTILLIMGLGTQMLAWHEDFCGQLAGEGFHVVRFDNRDSGRSTHLDAKPPTIGQLLRRDRKAAAYTLSDMAGDATGLLDHLGADRAHIVGASMGGMIAQTIAIEHPERVLSLTSLMSNTGGRFTGQPAFVAYPVLLKTAPNEREAYVEHIEKIYSTVGSPGFERDPEELREVARRSYDRSYSPASTARQLAAIIASGSRARDLPKITAPTLVIHGTKDKLVRPSGGTMTARAIPGAKLLKIDGMGHDLPRGAWPQIVGAIVQTARSAEGRATDERDSASAAAA
jgi:pimeloyl-ACP methyl ester carboxylesterase